MTAYEVVEFGDRYEPDDGYAMLLSAALLVAVDPLTAEALSLGESVPAAQLLPEWRAALDINGSAEFALDVETVRRIELLRRANISAEPSTNEAGKPGPSALIFDVLTAREVIAIPEPPDSDQILGPLARRGQRTIPVGDTGHGKTTIGYQMVRGIVAGDDVLGYTGAGAGPALIVDLEQGVRSIKRCLREAGLADRDDVHIVSIPDGLALDSDDAHLAELRRVVADLRPTVVLLDPYYKAHRADDPNAERPIIDLMRRLDALRAEHGFALIMPAHPRKDMPGRDGPRKLTLHDVAGSGAVTRGAEVVFGIERLSHGYARLRILKDRDGDLQVGDVWPLVFDRDRGFRLDPKEEVAQETIEQRIRDDLANGALRTAREWADELNIRQARARKILEQLAETGDLAIIVGPLGRSARARCYGTAPKGWDQSGSVGISRLDTATDPTDPDSSIGAVGSGSSTTSAPETGSVTDLEWS